MAIENKKIAELTALTTAENTDLLPVVDISEPDVTKRTKKITKANFLKELVASFADYYTKTQSDERYLQSFTEQDPDFNLWLETDPLSGYATESWVAEQGYLTSFDEQDPDFNAWLDTDPLSGFVTGTPWQDEGYITAESDPIFSQWLIDTPPLFSESDPVFSSSVAFDITDYDVASWGEAYSWGDHADAGYLKSFTETDPLSLHLDQTTPQSVTKGVPLFSGINSVTDNTYDLGTLINRWRTIYAGTLWATNGITIRDNVGNVKTTSIYAHNQSYDILYALPTTIANGLLRNTDGQWSWDTTTYLTGETDPAFSAWLSSTPPLYPGGWYDAVQNTIELSGFNNDLGIVSFPGFDTLANDYAGDTPWTGEGYLKNIVEDTTPQLGGDLDTNLKNTLFVGSGMDDNTGVGDVITDITAGESIAFPNLVYLKSDGKWWKVDANAVATCQGLIGIATESKNADQACKVLIKGFIRDDDWTWTVGSPVFATTTGGAVSQTAPTGNDDVVLLVGVATHADRMFFNPQIIPLEYKA